MFTKPPHPGFHRRRESRLAAEEHRRATKEERRKFADQVMQAIAGSLQAIDPATIPWAPVPGPGNATTH